jgi:iron complex outermembrane receptor protein
MKQTPLYPRGQRTVLAFAIASIFAAPVLAVAQVNTLEPVIVEGSAQVLPSPGSEPVPPAQLRSMRPATSDAASLLRDVPGVSLYGAGGLSSLPAIHGLADDRLRVKLDGMDLIASCPNHMNPALSYVDPSNVGSLSVYAGITPVSMGGDSIGGAIVATTRALRFAAPGQGSVTGGEVGMSYRTNNNARSANVSLDHATEQFSIAYDGAWSRADNYTAGGIFKTSTATGRDGHLLPLDEVGSTAFRTANHTLGVGFRGDGHLFEIKLGYQDMPYQLYPNQRMDLLGNEQQRVNLRYLGTYDWGSLEARAYHEKVDHFMDFGPDKRFWYGSLSGTGSPCSPIRFHGDPAGTCAAGMPMYSKGRTTGARVQADIDLNEDEVLRVGADLQRYRLDDWWTASGGGMGPGTFQNVNDGQRDRAGLFGEWEARLAPRWKTLVGLRYERVRTDAGEAQGYRTTGADLGGQIGEAAAFNALDRRKTDDNWDFAALARHTHDDTLDIEFGFAHKVRSPNLYERYTWSTWPMAATMNNFVGDGNGYVGDVDLRPEKAWTLSATLDWHAPDKRWAFKASPYFTLVDDYIDAVRLASWAPDRFNVLQYANQSARLYGVDLSGHMPLGKTALGDWGLEGLLAWTVGKNRDTGEHLYNIMPLNARLKLTHRYGKWDNRLEWVGAKAKSDVSATRNEIETSGYTLAHLRASYAWKQARLDFGVENLFDRLYGLPTGGAYLGQGSTMQINGVPWGVAVPGMGRTFYVGLTLGF